MIAGLLALLRWLRLGGAVPLARQWQGWLEAQRHRLANEAREQFLQALRCAGPRERIMLGRGADTAGRWHWCGLPLAEFTGMHWLVTGATGMGKSYEIAALLLQLLERRVPLIIVDYKSELTALVVNVLLPVALARGYVDLPQRARIIRPFDPERVPLLRLSEPDTRTGRDVHALALAQALAEASGADLGARMLRIILPLATLAVERNEPLTILSLWLRDPMRLARDGRTSSDPLVRSYVERELPRESQASLDALRARLDTVLHLEDVRLALSAPRCISYAECLESGCTMFDFGSPPAGTESAMRVLSAPSLGSLTRAILSRPMHEGSAPVVLVGEEIQEGLGPRDVAPLARLLSLARFKKVSLLLSTQLLAAIKRVDAGLVETIRTNVGAEISFRCSLADARELSDGTAARSPRQSLQSARAEMIERLSRLPRRSFSLWLKSAPYGPQLLRSPRLDMAALRAEAAGVPDEIRRQLRIGTTSVDRESLRRELGSEADARRRPRGPIIDPEPPDPHGPLR